MRILFKKIILIYNNIIYIYIKNMYKLFSNIPLLSATERQANMNTYFFNRFISYNPYRKNISYNKNKAIKMKKKIKKIKKIKKKI